MPEIGDIAPDFTLKETFDTSVTLSDYRGKKNVLLFFHPFSYTEICEGEICEIRDESKLERDDLEILNVACDAWPIRQSYKDHLKANGRFLADFWPHGATASAYGVFNADLGCALRGTFLVDAEGIIRWSVVNGLGEARSTDDYRAALAAL